MVLAPCDQKYKLNSIAITVSLANKETSKNQETACSATSCLSKPISRCMTCFNYYCYTHASGHQHSIDNFEILK